MRWKNTPIRGGTRRTIQRFLWWPLTIKGESRWLETALIEQTFVGSGPVGGGAIVEWANIAWVGEEKREETA